jgi:HAE1 family hydrophobic/amphiphilic exporter-1
MIVLMLFLHRSVKTMLAIPVLVCSSVMAVYISPWFFLLTLGLIVGFGLWFGRGALVIGIAIPVSSVATFLALGIAGRSFNVISLAGMAFAVGMLVDNAVVVLENIHRRIQQGEPSFQAAVSGTKEVAGAIIASTLTTVAVFLPVVFVEDTSGQLFRDIALAISFAVIFSLVCATTLMPTAAARLYLDFKQEDSSQINKLRWLNRLGSGVVEGIVRFNQMIQRSAVRAVSFVAFVLLAVVVLTIVLWPKLEYLPAGNRNMVFIRMSPPPGYNMDELMEMGKEIEEDLEPIWNANPQEEDQMDFPVIAYYFFSARTSGVAMGVQAYDPLRVAELMPRLKTYGDKFPGTRVVASQASLFGRGFSGGRTIDVEITGRDLEKLIEIGGEVIDRLQSGKDGVPSRLADAQMFPRPSLDLSSPEIHLIPDKVACAELGVTADELGYTVDAFVDGAYAGDFFYGGDKVDITLKGDRVVDLRTQDLEDLPIATRSGKLVPLSALANIEYSSGPEQIMRRERLRAITIQVTPPPEIALEEAMDIIKNDVVQPMLKDGSMGTGNVITLSGAADKLNQTWESLRWNLLLALLITYLLMAALFESWLYPLVIIFSVPLGAVGGLLGLALLNVFVLQTLDVLTMLGFVILIGTVVNNAILIVHQALNHIQEDGMQHREAIPLAVRSRIRPISITTITTVLGLLPLVLFPGAGSELYRGLGSVVLGGLLVSTVLTLVLVPTVFTLFMDARLVVANWLSASGIPEQALPVED